LGKQTQSLFYTFQSIEKEEKKRTSKVTYKTML